ncbi:hypothetical protein DW178_08340 [Eggerthella sp. AM16-19]|uniref:hypothetical protein n=1 Tax=Eggerthella sp. AM16-19 TaxID=2292042 RepID=UPI000E4B5C76|nr:hypothetical protein [Eggerthella sp. AM16-19]RHO38269.1 hypothetical protein DW178_08340 [Eggerthella sp. AM16-19]
MADEMRRFQFWENFYMPLRRIKDRSARAELALKILEAAFEDEPPEFDDMEGLVADTIVPLIQRDMETPKGGRGNKTASKTSRKPARKASENVSETTSETTLETGSESGLSDPFKAKQSEAEALLPEEAKLSASASAHRAAAACAAQRAEGAGQAGPGWERTGSRCRKCRRHMLKAPNGTMACPGCEPELTGSPAPGFAEAGAA